jgi:hypothetical protein
VREAILAMPETAWVPAITQASEEREGAAVCELKNLDLSAWPPTPFPPRHRLSKAFSGAIVPRPPGFRTAI